MGTLRPWSARSDEVSAVSLEDRDTVRDETRRSKRNCRLKSLGENEGLLEYLGNQLPLLVRHSSRCRRRSRFGFGVALLHATIDSAAGTMGTNRRRRPEIRRRGGEQVPPYEN